MTEARAGGVIVIDFGAQYAQLIARRVREAGVFSEIMPHTATLDEITARRPSAVILSGGPSSVYEENAPRLSFELAALNSPVFGICYGFQLMAGDLGGHVAHTGRREYGSTRVTTVGRSALFDGTPQDQIAWMSHGDAVSVAPSDYTVTATTESTPIAAFENVDRGFAGVQFHPEVLHSKYGQRVLENFLFTVAHCEPTWSPENILQTKLADVKRQIGSKHVICGLSGGVDSAVAAALVQRAVGKQLTCVFVDHGLLRAGEAEQVELDFVKATGVALHVVDASSAFLSALAGVSDPETKRKAIGREFITAFDGAARDIVAETGDDGGGVEFLVQGTLYPDVVESGVGAGAAVIKSHHNVGGLPDDLQFKLVEPLRDLFKDEVRKLGRELGVPEEIVGRQPFPGPGLAIRIVGEVTADRLEILRQADEIVRDELTKAGLDDEVWQCPVVLLADVRSVGVQGDGRTYGHPIVIRPVSSEDAMTADWSRIPYDVLAQISSRITNEVEQINRVVLDITSKPPGSIEWE